MSAKLDTPTLSEDIILKWTADAGVQCNLDTPSARMATLEGMLNNSQREIFDDIKRSMSELTQTRKELQSNNKENEELKTQIVLMQNKIEDLERVCTLRTKTLIEKKQELEKQQKKITIMTAKMQEMKEKINECQTELKEATNKLATVQKSFSLSILEKLFLDDKIILSKWYCVINKDLEIYYEDSLEFQFSKACGYSWINKQIGIHEYKIALDKMEQTNIETKTVRPIVVEKVILPVFEGFNINEPFIDHHLQSDQIEYKYIKKLIKNATYKDQKRLKVESIRKMISRDHAATFLLQKAELTTQGIDPNITFAFHGSCTAAPEILCRNDANLSYAKDGYLGYGFYTAINPHYCVKNGYAYEKDGKKILIGTFVIMGSMYVEWRDEKGAGYRSAPDGYHSRTITYKSCGTIIAVYRPEQVLCSYIITLK